MNVVDAVIKTWLDLAEQNRGTDRFRVSLAAFQSIAAGRMPAIQAVGESVGIPTADLKPLVQAMTEEGRLTVDQSGEVITGAGGLSLVESRHELDMFGRRYWVWCALDAVGIPAGLNVDAVVYSRCIDTGEPVEIEFADGLPESLQPEAMAISLLPPSLDQSLHDCCCSEIGFFGDATNISPPMVAVTVAEAMDLGRRLWRDGVPL
jgi:alkylmercury lyase